MKGKRKRRATKAQSVVVTVQYKMLDAPTLDAKRLRVGDFLHTGTPERLQQLGEKVFLVEDALNEGAMRICFRARCPNLYPMSILLDTPANDNASVALSDIDMDTLEQDAIGVQKYFLVSVTPEGTAFRPPPGIEVPEHVRRLVPEHVRRFWTDLPAKISKFPVLSARELQMFLDTFICEIVKESKESLRGSPTRCLLYAPGGYRQWLAMLPQLQAAVTVTDLTNGGSV